MAAGLHQEQWPNWGSRQYVRARRKRLGVDLQWESRHWCGMLHRDCVSHFCLDLRREAGQEFRKRAQGNERPAGDNGATLDTVLSKNNSQLTFVASAYVVTSGIPMDVFSDAEKGLAVASSTKAEVIETESNAIGGGSVEFMSMSSLASVEKIVDVSVLQRELIRTGKCFGGGTTWLNSIRDLDAVREVYERKYQY